jgi:uncharacterized DUF497 family protein
MEFEWDASKAVECFIDFNLFVLVDIKHSKTEEERKFAVGRSSGGRVLTTWFTERGRKIRIIGCAEWRKFRRLYYERTKDQ